MKYDFEKPQTKGAQRTLAAFSDTLFKLLAQKSFESISVNEICQLSNFPRATFYNYFEDKSDLLNYCWYTLTQLVHLEDYKKLTPGKTLHIYFDRIYDLFHEKQTLLSEVLQHNSIDGAMATHFINYFRNIVNKLFLNSFGKAQFKIPMEIIAAHYSNTILLILEWIFLQHHNISRETAHGYLQYLLGSLQQPSSTS